MGKLADGRTTIERARWQRDLAGEMHKHGLERSVIDWVRAEQLWSERLSPTAAANMLREEWGEVLKVHAERDG
jgi:hypothetical protein